MKTLATILCTCLLATDVTSANSGAELIEASGIRGGVVVHVDFGSKSAVVSTPLLRTHDAFLVHGLSRDPQCVDETRKKIQSLKLYGPVSVDRWDGRKLPYGDNMANLIIVEEGTILDHAEILRVLAPFGVAMTRSAGQWKKTIKPWPEDMDQWTHFLHGPENNAVAQDRIAGPPRHVQWIGYPKYARSHEHLASVSAMVSANGRLFYVIDEGSKADIRLPPKWQLVARDAFNGVVLWKRRIANWSDHLHGFRSGPAELPFRLVATGDRVYVTLGIDHPVTALDARTGKTTLTYTGSEHTRQILRTGDKLIMLIGAYEASRRGAPERSSPRTVMVAHADTARVLWQKEVSNGPFLPLAATDDKLLYQTREHLICLELDSGREEWKKTHPIELGKNLGRWAIPTITACNGIVYVADFRKLSAFSLEDGKALWATSSAQGFNSPPDVFVINDQVWRGYQRGRGSPDLGEGLNARTGEVEATIVTDKAWEYPTLAHFRCYRPKATCRFILSSRSGIEFINIESGDISLHHWVRGTCQYGVMPCNGLVYAPPHSCACNIKTMIRGMCALAPTSSASSNARASDEHLIVKGPAYRPLEGDIPQRADHQDWPTYRHDGQRSGQTAAKVPGSLRKLWNVSPGSRLSSPVVSRGKVFVAAIDAHSVHALDIVDGQQLWSVTVGGRVDSPPTIYGNLVLFGAADGWVYCLRESDGALVWRFRAAPEERRIVVRGQLESAWPVHGSVLINNDTLVFAAGRSSYLDGGIHVYRMEPTSGEVLSKTVIDSLDPKTGKQPDGGVDLRGVLNGVLAASGESVYMRHLKIDFQTGDDLQIGPPHLFAPMGFLDDAWWHRSYWLFGSDPVCMPPTNESGWNIWPRMGNMVPSGRLLSVADDIVYGYGRDRYPGGGAGQIRGGEKYHLFAMEKNALEPLPSYKQNQHLRHFRSGQALGIPVTQRDRRYGEPKLHRTLWSRRVPIYARALVLADKTLVLAGPPELPEARSSQLVLSAPDRVEAVFRGRHGAKLLLTAAEDGRQLATYELATNPVFDGMLVAQQRVVISLENGSVVCFGK